MTTIDFSGAGTSGVRKHARDPAVRSSSEEEDDEVVTALVRKWSSFD